MPKHTVKPLIYDYKDFAEYLNALYKFRKRTEASFSYEKWAEEMGIKSRSYLRSMVLGENAPTLSLVPSLLRGLKLNEEETSYFITLINFQLAPAPEIKAIYMKEIFRRWTRQIQETQIQDIAEFLADPVVPQLFTYLGFEDSPSDIQQWASDLRCSEEQIKNALKCLIWQKLVDGAVQDNGDVVYRTTSPFFRIPSDPANAHLKRFHAEGLKQAQEAAQKSSEHRKMYSAFVALSPEFAKAQGLIQDFNQQILAIFHEKSIAGKKVYRLNQQLISVSEAVQTQKN
jgi:uncharacterized protein (TIGR02147 family)